MCRTILLIFLVSFIYCEIPQIDEQSLKFLFDEAFQGMDFGVEPDHGAGMVWLCGFFNGTMLFDNVQHKRECLAFLPVVHDDWVAIEERFRNVTHEKEAFDAVKFMIDKLEHMYNVMRASDPHCKAMASDVERIMKIVRKHISYPEYFQNMAKHAFMHIGILIQKIENGKEMCRAHKWGESGYAYGDLFRFLFLWDFPVPPSPQDIQETMNRIR